MVFLPALGALALAFFPRGKEEAVRYTTLGVTILTFMLSLGLFFDARGVEFKTGVADMQDMFSAPWIPTFGIQYLMGLDGISFAPALQGRIQPERPFLYRESPAGNGQQAVTVGDLHVMLSQQPQVRFVDERRRRQRVVGRLAAQLPPRDPPQFVVDDRHQRFERRPIAGSP
jgi:hypothetical protein